MSSAKGCPEAQQCHGQQNTSDPPPGGIEEISECNGFMLLASGHGHDEVNVEYLKQAERCQADIKSFVMMLYVRLR